MASSTRSADQLVSSAASNDLKQRLLEPEGAVLWGLFTSFADPVAAEICAGAGFDVVVIDA